MIDISSFQHFNHIEVFDELPSTNAYALDKCNQGKINTGTIIIAKHQTAGKGRFGNNWVSNPGDLFVSYIIRPQCLEKDIYKVTIPFSLATYKALLNYIPVNIDLRIKWPNDLLLQGKKCGGILANYEKKSQLVIIGLGINLNSEWTSSDNRLSFGNLMSQQLEIETVFYDITQSIDDNFQDISSCIIDCESWNSASAFLNQDVVVSENSNQINGEFKGISECGSALIKNMGQVKKIKNGITFRLASHLI